MKHHKLLSLLLAAALSVVSMVPAGAYAAANGDLDGDGVISADDLSMLQGHILGDNELTSDQSKLADLNSDGAVNSMDVSQLRKLILKTARNLKYKAVSDRISDGYTDALKKLDTQKGGTAVKSTDELKAALSPYFSEKVVNTYLAKYDDKFFTDSVLLVKPVYFDPEVYKKNTVTKLGCGCSSEYAGTYTPSDAVTEYMNIRASHDFNSESLGRILPGATFTITYSDGHYGHVTYNGITGYVNMDYVRKISSPPVEYRACPDIKLDSVKYADGKVTVSASEYNISSSVEFAAAVIAQAVLPRKDYYASETNWTVSTTTTVTTTTTTTTCTYPLADQRLNEIGRDLKKAFNDSASITYYGHTADMPQDDKTTMEWYADYGFKNRKGNCYVMAAMFCEMAKILGYDAHQISGKVPLKAGGYGPHSWVEVTIDGTLYVCDPDFQNETKKNGYMIQYKQSGTWMYVKESVMS